MTSVIASLPSSEAMTAFIQVVLIDLVLAADNAVAVGLMAASLPPAQRRKAITLGLAAAVVLLISFALVATQLLKVVGLLLVGGLLLLLVCWKMWRELSEPRGDAAQEDKALLRYAPTSAINAHVVATPRKSLRQAVIQILIADLTMSLDNVLAVAGAARAHPAVLVVGLILSVTLMGFVATWLAELLNRHRWIGYLGLFIILYVALHMVWEGGSDVIRSVDDTIRDPALVTRLIEIARKK